MKTIGLIGGIGWASTLDYYRIINEETHRRLGAHHSAPMLIYSFDFEELAGLQNQGRFEEIGVKFVDVGKRLRAGGAELLVIGANTSHMFADLLEEEIKLPLVHIIDVTAKAIKEKGLKKVGLLGTKFTMQMDFYKDRLRSHGVEALIPNPEDVLSTTTIIRDELYYGHIRPPSKELFLKVIDRLKEVGAEGVVLGCTEIPLLVQPGDHALPLFDTTRLHALAAVKQALG